MSAWLKRLGSDADDGLIEEFSDEWRAIQEEVAAELKAEPPLSIAPLPPYDHDAMCPKCRFIAGTTSFQRGYHGNGCTVPESPIDFGLHFFGLAGLKQSREKTRSRIRTDLGLDRLRAAIPEHFERECPNCKFKWAEAVA